MKAGINNAGGALAAYQSRRHLESWRESQQWRLASLSA
jgi:hypothetical protein